MLEEKKSGDGKVSESTGSHEMQGAQSAVEKRKRCVIIVDSNGRDASSSELIKSHIPKHERDKYDIEVTVAYRIEEAYDKVERGAIVIIDCLTNMVKETCSGPGQNPDELVWCVDRLRERLWAAAAAEIIICQIKPTLRLDVSHHNRALDAYLRSQMELDGGHGCCTQIRLDYLRADGLHLKPQFFSVLNKTYACAIMGASVPDPTPYEDFTPMHVRRRWESEWPRLRGESRI